jgi:predicted HicB family RNase H-like nuclease
MPVEKKSLPEEDKKLLIRLPKELHRQVRLLAFEMNVSMRQLCKEGLEMVLQKYKKKSGNKKSS